MYRYERLINQISTIMAVIAAIFLFVATVILTWMVVGRQIGIHGSWELELAIELMVSAVFLGSPYTLKTGGYVKMDLLGFILGIKARAILLFTTQLLGLLVCFFLGMKGLGIAYEAFITEERGMGLWQPLLWPRYTTVPIGMFVTCLQYLVLIRQSKEQYKLAS